jgi:hypothetical protein
MGRLFHEQRLRLADHHRRDARRHLDRGDDAARAGPEPDLDGVHRVAVRRDEVRAGPDVVRGGGDPQVRHLRVHAGDDRAGPAGGGDAVDALPGHPFGGVAGVDDLQPDVAKLTVQPARADRQDAPDLGVVLLQVQGGRPGRAHDAIQRDRRAELGQPRHVVRAVVHRVVRDVDDVVARRGARGQDVRDARDRVGAPIDDAIEIDEEQEGHRAGCYRAPGDSIAR